MKPSLSKLFLTLAAVACLASGSVTASTALIHFDHTVSKSLKRQVIDDLNFLRAVPEGPQSELHQKIFGRFSGFAYVRWFTDRVRWIGFDDEADDGTVAYNVANESQMFITKSYLNDKIPQVARLSVLFHEARHSEPFHNFWDHAKCPVPFLDENGKDVKSALTGLKLQGRKGCDRQLLGAYAIATVMLYNLAVSCETCSEKMKMDAEFYANESRDRMTQASHRKRLTKDFETLKSKRASL